MIQISSSQRQRQDQDQEVDHVLQLKKPRIMVTELLNTRSRRVVLVERLATRIIVKSFMGQKSAIFMLEK
jgi:hypothetical protein